MTKILSFLLTIVFVFTAYAAQAVEVENLYRGKILVSDKTQKTRVKAHRWAIEQVLTKVTGSRDILDNKTVQYQIRVKTANYIKSFAFVTDEQDRVFLVDEFDQEKIDGLIRSVNGSIWGQRRPNSTIWLVVDEGSQRQLADQQLYPQITEATIQSAENRGLPIVFPEMTSDMRERVFVSDVWARFDQVIYPESKRYNAEHFVMARLRYVDSLNEPEYQTGWVLDYQLFDGRKFLHQGVFNGQQFEVMRALVNDLGDYFANQYAINNNEMKQEVVTLTVSNIKSMATLKQVEGHINGLPPVKRAAMEQVANNQVRFTLWLSGQALDVTKALDLLPNFSQQKVVIADPSASMTVEEQLDQLSREYTGVGQTGNDTLPKEQQVIQYLWMGN